MVSRNLRHYDCTAKSTVEDANEGFGSQEHSQRGASSVRGDAYYAISHRGKGIPGEFKRCTEILGEPVRASFVIIKARDTLFPTGIENGNGRRSDPKGEKVNENEVSKEKVHKRKQELTKIKILLQK